MLLVTKKRELSENCKRLRKSGQVPGVIYGKHLKEPMHIKIDESDLTHFLKEHDLGAQVEVKYGTKKHMVMLKDLSRAVMSSSVMHIDFQALTAGEKVKVHAHIKLHGKENVPTGIIVQELIHEIEYEALPKDLIEHVDVDLSELRLGDDVKVKDLDISKNKKIHLLTDPDAVLLIMSSNKGHGTSSSGSLDEDVIEPEITQSAEVPVIGEEGE